MGPCVSFAQLERLLDERLDDRDREAVEDHVEGCTACQQALEGLVAARDEARGRKEPPSDPGREDFEAGFLRSFKDRGPPHEPGLPGTSRLPDGEGLSSSEGGPAVGPRPSPTIAGFRIIREVGRGGMGVVYEAIELALGRRAALKLLNAHRAAPSVVERFQREARAAAGLHHPNIVPVFGVGEDRGQLYYVMQFIEGENLGQVFDRLRTAAGSRDSVTARAGAARPQPLPGTESDGASPETVGPLTPHPSSVSISGEGSHSVYFRTIARIGRQVAEALAYAHARGVLHRDIKPANLLLDPRGDAWVADFGLAKAFEKEDGLTLTGEVVGTVRYMAPERFDGRSEPRSDVYALGVTLYELLALRPLFDEPNRVKLIERVLHEEPVPPRRVDGRIPRDLETIVQKAMAKEPGARYASAAALAEDLRRFLANEPVLARPIGHAGRLARWCRRQPKLAATIGLAASSLVLTTGLSIALAWSQYRSAERSRAEQALTLAAKTRAEENFRDARQAVEDYLIRVSDETLLRHQDSAELRQLRKHLLEDALKYYQRFLTRQPDDPKLLAEVAQVYSNIAGIIGEIGSITESIDAYRRAVSIWERIVREAPDDPRARNELAGCLLALGDGNGGIGRHDESLRCFEQSLAILRPLARAYPTDINTRNLLGVTLTYRGMEQDRIKETAAAIRSFREALPILEAQARDRPDDAPLQRRYVLRNGDRPVLARRHRDLADVYQGLGVAQQSAGQSAEALHSLEKAVTLWRGLVRDYPTVLEYPRHLAVCLNMAAFSLDEMGQPARALLIHREALAIFDSQAHRLVSDHFGRAERADTLDWIAACQHKLGRTAEAIGSYEQARLVIRNLADDHPDIVRFRQALCICDTGLAALYREVGRRQEALDLLDEAQGILERLPQVWPTYHYHLACCLCLRIPPTAAGRSPREVEDVRRYGDRAMDALRRSAAGGFKIVETYRTDPNLDPLRDREDFRSLLLDIAFPADPFTP